MVDRVADNPETSSCTALTSVVGRVDADPFDVIHSVHLPVRFAWSEPGDACTMVAGCGTGARIMSERGRRLEDLRRRGTRILSEGEVIAPDGASVPDRAFPRWFGGISFPGRPDASDLWKPLGSASFLIPSIQVTNGEDGTWVSVTTRDGAVSDLKRRFSAIRERVDRRSDRTVRNKRAPELRRIAQEPADPDAWRERVETVLEAIEGGSLQKAVLAQRRTLAMRDELSPGTLLRRLFDARSSSYRFLLARGGRVFIGRSPECLVRKQGRSVRSESVGGTAEAGASEEEKRAFAEQLRDNRKDQREHSFVVRSIRDRLAPYCDEIKEGTQTVRVQSNVQHLCTPINATLADDRHVLELVDTLHPTAAVGGVPRDRALEMIRDLEPFERGLYSGPVGWFDREGDGCFAVGIRSGVQRGDQVHLYAGAGIVEGSQPDREWEEVQWKFETMTDLLADQSDSV